MAGSRSEFITFLEIAAKTMIMYQESHPKTQQIIDKIYGLVLSALEGKESMTISETEGNLFLDGELVTKDIQVEHLVKSMVGRSVHSITFNRGISKEELTNYLRSFNLKPGKIQELGGLPKVLQDNHIRNVHVNKVKYGIIGEEGSLDQAFLSDLLVTVQSIIGGNSDAGASAITLEKSLETSTAPDPGGLLFRVFQMMSQKDPSQSDAVPMDIGQRFNQLFHSFTPAMQANLLFSAVLKDLHGKDSLYGFYRNLSATELEPAILALLDKPLSTQDQKEFVKKLSTQESLMSAMVRSKLKDLGLLEQGAAGFFSLAESLLSMENMLPEDIEKVPAAITELLSVGNLTDADRLSKRLFGYLTIGNPEQKISVIKTIPAIVQTLATQEKWKNVEISLSFFMSTCFRKEIDDQVLRNFLSLLLETFRRNCVAGNASGCQEILGALRSQIGKNNALRDAMSEDLPRFSSFVSEEIHKGSQRLELIFELVRLGGKKGAEILVDLLTEEEDQANRSRVIQQICNFQSSELFPVLEQRLADSRWYVVRNMVTIVSKLNLPEIPGFYVAAAAHQDPRVAKEMIKLLFKTSGRNSSRFIAVLLSHPDKAVRLQAIHLAAMNPYESTAAGLLHLITAADTEIRATALQALLKLKSLEVVPFAAALLEKKPASKLELNERNTAVRILGELDRDRSRALLQKVAQTDPNTETRTLASHYLK